MASETIPDGFEPHDFEYVHGLLTVAADDDVFLRAALSNNLNVILAALRRAARPAQAEPVAVKALTWSVSALNDRNDLRVPFKLGIAVLVAPSLVGTYAVVKLDADGRFAPWLGAEQLSGPTFSTKEQAVVAGQADFARRIGTALSPSRADGLRALPDEPPEVAFLRNTLVKQAASSTFNEWQAREVVAYIDRLLALASTSAEGMVPTHRHVKCGSVYVLIGYGKMQAEWWRNTLRDDLPVDDETVDMEEVAIYRSVDDGSLWARPREEFEDGRFIEIAAASTPGAK